MKIKTVLCLTMLLYSLFVTIHAHTSYVKQIPINIPYDLEIFRFTPKAVFPCTDNSVVIIGEIEYTVNEEIMNYRGCAVKLDSLGNRLWQRYAFEANYWFDKAIGIDIDQDNSVFYIMEHQHEYAIFKTDANGNTTSPNRHWFNQLGKINRAIRLPNGEIIAIGYGYGYTPNNPYSTEFYAFMRMSATGDSLAYRQYPPGENNVFHGAYALDMELDSDGFPLAVCSIDSSVVSVVKFDLDGNIIQRNDWNSNMLFNSAHSYRISRKANTNYSIISFPMEDQLKVLKFNGSTFEDFITIPGDIYCDSALEYTDGILLAGFELNNHNLSTFVKSFDVNGEPNWNWTTGPFFNFSLGNNSTERLAISPDSCIIYVGSGDRTINIVKFFPDGQVPVDDEVVYPVKSMISIYPNPFRQMTTILIKIDKNLKLIDNKLSIYNIKGQKVRTLLLERKSANSFSTVWDGYDDDMGICSSGLYLFKANINGDVISKKITLVRD